MLDTADVAPAAARGRPRRKTALAAKDFLAKLVDPSSHSSLQVSWLVSHAVAALGPLAC